MSFFYTEPVYKDPNQLALELVQFWPLTEQIPLELSYEGCDTQPKLISNVYPLSNSIEYGWSTVATNIAPSLTINPTNSVGELSIGGISVGLETKPTWVQRQLHKLLGFNWKDK
jgi:hypothetical protein